MSLQSLTPPQDITWKRMAYSRDMIDTNFGDLALTPKWRSSLAVYYYIVPEEETADAYPDSRIVYLKLTCSITGWNPSEELRGAKQTAQDSGALDDLQKSIWEVITAKGWASVYWPCLGAIAQLAVYPGKSDTVGPDDYPYIVDFEPKKRELYESVSESSEQLSGSSEKVSTTKGSTTTKSAALEAGFAIGPFGAKASGSLSKQTVDNRTTDTGRESRETEGRSTSFSQMYQLFNGYHLATNRALFVIAPRPHIVSSGAQTEFNLINGERKLEGIQEMFLVVHLPRSLKGFCVQASIDTGHTVQQTYTQAYALRRQDNDYPGQDDDLDDPPPPGDPPPPQTGQQLVVTRRIVQSCGKFEDNGGFTLTGGGREPIHPPVVYEDIVVDIGGVLQSRRARALMDVGNAAAKAVVANQMNTMQSHVVRSMLSGVSAGNYTPRPFVETKTFLRLSGFSLNTQTATVDELLKRGHITDVTAKLLRSNKIRTLSELFDYATVRSDADALKVVRADLMRKLLIKPR
jgi:hypothetical protein